MSDTTKNAAIVSEITPEDIAAYLRLDVTDAEETKMLRTFLSVAKSYIKSYTGIKEEDFDNYPDFVIVVYLMCQDFYDNRSLVANYKDEVNPTVKTILDMHTVNNL